MSYPRLRVSVLDRQMSFALSPAVISYSAPASMDAASEARIDLMIMNALFA